MAKITKTTATTIDTNLEVVRDDLIAERRERARLSFIAATHGFHGKLDSAILKAVKITKAKDDDAKRLGMESILGLFSRPVLEEHEVPHPVTAGATVKIKIKVGVEYLLDRRHIADLLAMQMAKLGLSSSPLADLLKAEGFYGKAQASEATMLRARGIDPEKFSALKEKVGSDLLLTNFAPAAKKARKAA